VLILYNAVITLLHCNSVHHSKTQQRHRMQTMDDQKTRKSYDYQCKFDVFNERTQTTTSCNKILTFAAFRTHAINQHNCGGEEWHAKMYDEFAVAIKKKEKRGDSRERERLYNHVLMTLTYLSPVIAQMQARLNALEAKAGLGPSSDDDVAVLIQAITSILQDETARLEREQMQYGNGVDNNVDEPPSSLRALSSRNPLVTEEEKPQPITCILQHEISRLEREQMQYGNGVNNNVDEPPSQLPALPSRDAPTTEEEKRQSKKPRKGTRRSLRQITPRR
jgi:uncharacterized small protein (DUF1192 family)